MHACHHDSGCICCGTSFSRLCVVTSKDKGVRCLRTLCILFCKVVMVGRMTAVSIVKNTNYIDASYRDQLQ